jgi:hypothetical protein
MGYREERTAHPTDGELAQNTTRIARIAVKVCISRHYVRVTLFTVIARKSARIDRKHKYRPQHRPHKN